MLLAVPLVDTRFRGELSGNAGEGSNVDEGVGKGRGRALTSCDGSRRSRVSTRMFSVCTLASQPDQGRFACAEAFRVRGGKTYALGDAGLDVGGCIAMAGTKSGGLRLSRLEGVLSSCSGTLDPGCVDAVLQASHGECTTLSSGH